MTDIQIFQAFGIGLFAMGFAWVMKPQGFRRTLRDIADNRGVLLTLGVSVLIVGFMIIALHETSFELVTFLGWAAFIKGLAVIFLSAADIRVTTLYAKLRLYYAVLPWLVLIVSIIFLTLGFLG